MSKNDISKKVRLPADGGDGEIDSEMLDRIVLRVSSAILSLPRDQLRRMEVLDSLDDFARSVVDVLAADVESPDRTQPARSPSDALTNPAQGRAPDHVAGAYEAFANSVESWAGPVVGQTVLEKQFGIPRSTLHLWQRRGEVVALRKSVRHHVFPVAQFVDGRPVAGLHRVQACFASARLAWSWLIQAAPELGGEAPIDLLKQDRVTEVVVFARRATLG